MDSAPTPGRKISIEKIYIAAKPRHQIRHFQGMTPALSQTHRLSVLDYLFTVMDSDESPMDFAVVFRFNEGLDVEALRVGAQSARRAYPITSSRISGNRWVRDEVASYSEITTARCSDPENTIRDFLNRPLNIEKHFPVQQLVITGNDMAQTTLVTRFHHAACDGVSAALWLRHQLEVAKGIRVPESGISSPELPVLRTSESATRKSRFAFSLPCHKLASSTARSGSRSWKTIELDARGLRDAVRQAGSFTYSDLLATCALEAFRLWNQQRHSLSEQRIGLWLPVNMRQHLTQGFGNATSRVRIYANYPDNTSLIEKCREVRRQIRWCLSNGEWVIPDFKALTLLPRALTSPILRLNLKRSSLDMSTGVFSHVDRWNLSDDVTFKNLQQISCLGLLHPFHALAINGATHRAKTWLTFTYDTGLLGDQDVKRLVELYLHSVDRLRTN